MSNKLQIKDIIMSTAMLLKYRLHLLTLALLLLIAAGCAKENDLKKSVFIPDEDNPELPAYSEWGYNTFGAYYDRQLFISDDYIVPVKVIVEDSATSFELSGRISGVSYYDNEMTLSFIIKNYKPDTYTDLSDLDGRIIDLTQNPVRITLNESRTEIEIISGQIEFKRAQILSVDEESIETILSGYFDFKAIIDGEPVTVSDGRFDVGIGEDNFYIMD